MNVAGTDIGELL